MKSSARGKRSFDFILSIALLLALSPILAIGYVLSGWAFHRTPRLGQWRMIFEELSFDTNNGLAGRVVQRLHITRIPVLLNIARGNMSFVGPLPKSQGDLSAQETTASVRYDVRPGLISLWWIRRRCNIDYETEYASDMEYVENHSFWGDIGICLRAIPAMLYGDKGPVVHDKVNLMGITIDNLTMDTAIQTILSWLKDEGSRQVCFVNADCVNIAYQNRAYLEVLKRSDLCLADGIGLKLAGKFLDQEIAQNLCGTDMFPRLCESISGTDVKLFLLGARPEAVEGVVEWIREHHHGVQVCGYQHGYFQPEEEPGIIQRIKDSGAQLLLVAFGVPKQDVWIHENLNETGVRVAMGVGGLFDFYSGRIPRAPLWMREIGMEWLYRLIQEPRRMWKRYLIGNGLFLWWVLKERFSPRER
ncbi:MAG: WecB/TagA/CpsF family glycosyltransferase [Desulfomonilaceae bacterium]